MAGEWIKMRHDLADDPSVVMISKSTQLSQDTVIGKLQRLWSWADRHTVTGREVSVTTSWVDEFLLCSGFAKALIEAGWLIDNGASITFPKFTRHNGESAKRRALTQKRVQAHRSRKCNAPSVTSALPERALPERALPEESREEKSREEEYQTPLPPFFLSSEFKTLWSRWLDHRAKLGRPLTEPARAELAQKLAEWGESRAVAALKFSLSNGYSGVFEESQKPSQKSTRLTPEEIVADL